MVEVELRKRKKIEPIVEKIKKPKPKGEYISKLAGSRMGTPPMEDRELTDEQKKFAMLLARNVPYDIAQEKCSFSDYQRRSYLQLPKMQEEIKKWQEVFAKDETERLISLWNKVTEESLILLLDRVKTGKVTNQELFKNIINKSPILSGSMTPEDDTPLKRAMKITRKLTTGNRQPLFLPSQTPKEEDILDGITTGSEEGEFTLTEEEEIIESGKGEDE